MIQPDEIIRSRRKNLSISIDSFGRLIVRAPLHCSEQRIFSFIEEKEGWIQRKQAQMKGAGIQLPTENLDGYTFLLLGQPCTIHLYDGKEIRFDKEKSRIWLPEKGRGNPRSRLIGWLKSNATRIFTAVTEQKAQEMGLRFQSVTISATRGVWGTCSAKNEIRYTFRLLYAPKEIIEYVVVHELAHIVHKNHSAQFWALVTKYQPNWKEKRKWMGEYSYLLQIF